MTFAARVLLTILAVVVVTTAAALYVAQRQTAAAYGSLVDELLRQRTAAFQQEQETRHRLAVDQAAELAGSVRLFAALEADDPEVYKIASDELRLGDFDFFRLQTARSRIIAPPADGRAGALELTELTMPLAPESVHHNGSVQLGFVATRPTDGEAPPRLYRVLAAPVHNFGSRVGTLFMGQRIHLPAADGATADSPAQGLMSAVWVEGEMLGSTLDEEIAQALGRTLTSAPTAQQGEFSAAGSGFRYQRTRLNEGSGYPPAHLVTVFSMAGLTAQQRALTWRIVLTGTVAFLGAGLVALALSRQLASPVAALVAATGRIRAGDYTPRLTLSSTREMAELGEAFNAMAEDLALKDRYHCVLQQVADPQVAEALVNGHIKLGGELRDVTVLFCDIRQYTALTLDREPEAVIELLNHHLGAMAAVVQDHGGVINQFAGDAVMALFGAPRSYGDDTQRAVRCARAMIVERERLNRDAAVPLQVGVGIASGQMVAGCIGAESRSDYTVVGARVNLAARLSSTAGAGEILVDEATRERIAALFPTEPLQPMSLKGFAEPVPAWRVEPGRSVAA